jgi:hypothetical protein
MRWGVPKKLQDEKMHRKTMAQKNKAARISPNGLALQLC